MNSLAKSRRRKWNMVREDADDRSFHSWSYHRHFEQYVEYRVLQPNGRTKLVRTYAGKWYKQKLNRWQYIMIRLFYLTMFGLIVCFFSSAAVSIGAGGASRCAAAAGCASVLLLTVMAYELLVNYIFAPRKMTIGDYKCCTRMVKTVSIGLTVSFVANAVVVLVNIIVNAGGNSNEEAMGVLKFLACAVMAFAVFRTEKSLIYEEVEQTSHIPEEAIEITADE